jgi:hypothetical protein
MNSLVDRLAAIDAARLVAVSGALLGLLLVAGWVVSAATGRWDNAALAAAVVTVLIAALGLLYAFRLGPPSASV